VFRILATPKTPRGAPGSLLTTVGTSGICTLLKGFSEAERGPCGPLSEWVCKPDPVVDDHPSRPTSRTGGASVRQLPAAYLDLTGPGRRSCLALHRTGFAWPPRHRDAGALLPHLFTFACSRLTCGRAIGRVFLWHCPAGFPGWALPTVLALGCPDFPRGVFSPPAAVRPTPLMIRTAVHSVARGAGPDEHRQAAC